MILVNSFLILKIGHYYLTTTNKQSDRVKIIYTNCVVQKSYHACLLK